MSQLLWQQIVSGVVTGGIYAAFAVGLTVTFGITHVVNFAHGGFVLIGAYAVALLVESDVPYVPAAILAACCAAVVAAFVERFLFRATMTRPFNGLVVSAGLLVILEGTMLELFGSDVRSIAPWTYDTVGIFGAEIAVQRLIVGALGFLSVLLFWALVQLTRFGLHTKAVAEDRETAELLGLRSGLILNINFVIGAAIAALAGALLATIQPVTAFSAEGPTLIAFTVIIVGSLGSIPGAILAAVLIAILTNVGVAYADPSLALVYQFGVVIVVLVLKPEGLLRRSLGEDRA